MKRVFGWGPTLTVFMAFSAYLAVYSWPSSWWFEARSTVVFDSRVDEQIQLVVDRSIYRPFIGEWSVLVRRVDESGTTIQCQASGSGNYRVDSDFPSPLTLDWWTAGKCVHLPAGKYIMTTVWRIPGLFGLTKTVAIDSNPFTVSQPASDG